MQYSILINTCDKFEDCWNPFFKLWRQYWSDCRGVLYLNTEYKDYSYPDLDIIPVKACEGKTFKGKFATWSQCLKWALDKIDTELILYLQEDYFLNGKVDNAQVEHYIEYMEKHPEIPCIQLSTVGIPVCDVADEIEHLHYSDPSYFSYVSCQASIWRKNILCKIARPHETAWNFEWWGSKRAKYMKMKFLTINHEWLQNGNEFFPYLKTGVIGGKWYKPVVKLFSDHNISMDFSRRGFYDPHRKKSIRERIKLKISIYRFKSIWEVFCMKYGIK